VRRKRIRCRCCKRLMSYLPYKPGDAIRRAVPQAGHCVDCRPVVGNGFRMHDKCEPLNAVDRLALLLHRQENPKPYPG
jgi:hypothetical protein